MSDAKEGYAETSKINIGPQNPSMQRLEANKDETASHAEETQPRASNEEALSQDEMSPSSNPKLELMGEGSMSTKPDADTAELSRSRSVLENGPKEGTKQHEEQEKDLSIKGITKNTQNIELKEETVQTTKEKPEDPSASDTPQIIDHAIHQPQIDEQHRDEPNAVSQPSNNLKAGIDDTQPTSDTEFDPHPRVAEVSKPEIQTIMSQFKDASENTNTGPPPSTPSTLPVFQYPPRTSSLEHAATSARNSMISTESLSTTNETSSHQTPSDPEKASLALTNTQSNNSIAQPPLPEPDPEPDLPFDFHRFLEQLRHRTADPVAKFLRSFLQEFGKKQWLVHEQVKIISDFLAFIAGRMGQCEVWRLVSEAEFDNAKEGMEKLVMNRLYTQTFSPLIPPPEPAKVRRKGVPPAPLSGRRGQHQEDVERDEVLAQKVRIYGWIKEEHLEIRQFNDKGRKFLTLAQQELAKVKTYRAPRDKIICILNCCKVLFGFLRNARSEQSADAFIPLLIYTVLKARPDHLVSNVQYILRFRNQDKLSGEAGYYMSSLMGAVQFIENLDRTSLTIPDEEFEKNVEQAVSAIAEKQPISSQPQHPQQHQRASSQDFPPRTSSAAALNLSKKSTPSRPEVTPRHSLEGERATPRRNPGHVSRSSVGRASISIDAASTSDESEDNAAVAGFLRTIQKPLNTIGRMFSDENTTSSERPLTAPQSSDTQIMQPAAPSAELTPEEQAAISAHNVPSGARAVSPGKQQQQTQQQMAAEDAAARQASVETADADRARQAEYATVIETLKGMFPDLDHEVIADVVRMKGGRVGVAVDACLALSR